MAVVPEKSLISKILVFPAERNLNNKVISCFMVEQQKLQNKIFLKLWNNSEKTNLLSINYNFLVTKHKNSMGN